MRLEPRAEIDEHQSEELKDDEGDDASIDVGRLEFRRRDTLQEEQGPTEGRCQERGLEIDRDEDRDPGKIHARLMQDGQKQRQGDIGNLDPFQEEAENEEEQHQEEKLSVDAAGHEGEGILDQTLAAQTAKGQREDLRKDQDEEDHGAGDEGAAHHLSHDLEIETP